MNAGADLAAMMTDIALALFGEPERALSTATQWRYGRKGSLAIDVARAVWFDHEAGAGGGMLDLVARALQCDRRAAAEWLASNRLSPCIARTRTRAKPAKIPSAYALHIWQSAQPAINSPVAAYLASRGLGDALESSALAPVIRYAPNCPFGKGVRMPAMLALLSHHATGQPQAIRRTALFRAGARARDVSGFNYPHKALGPSAGAIVRLCAQFPPPAQLGVCEGLETGLSVMAVGGGPVWACLSAGNLAALPVLATVERLTIYADHDPPGLKAARACAQRWANAGRTVAIQIPPTAGADFNDMLMEQRHG